MGPSFLFPETNAGTGNSKIVNEQSKAASSVKAKSFVSVVSNNVCDIPLSQLPTPCLKGDRLAITIPEDEYALGVEACKHHLHGRVVWSKGSQPLTVVSLKNKLLEVWPQIGKWGITSLGKGFFEFAFSSLEDVQRLRSVNAWSIPNGILKLFPWTKDFIPSTLKQTSAQVWIRVHGLSQEYWRPKILFTIASSIGTPICIDSASNKSAFERPFGHFVRILVDLDLTKELSYKILVERVGFAFLVDIEYEKIPNFCTFCNCIGHSVSNCKRKKQDKGKAKETISKKDKTIFIPTGKRFIAGESSKANLEDHSTEMNDGEDNNHTNTNLVVVEDSLPNGKSVDHINRNIDTVALNDVNNEAILVPILKPQSLVDLGTADSSESEFVDATLQVDYVPETQLDERFKNQVTEFLSESWNNMADMEDPGVDLFQQKDFQLVTNKKKRNKKIATNTRRVSGPNHLTL
ncbi:uncharacterized protein LOC131627787 [Vicia villosa]|uniref:uncharacterized protein LOC131627787 n=1 Tax=Vicia villosa TaxID=3911 RepID=UPI00273AA895|nr:uncharacterized protein LOC131627787 [Vicia villosa]